MRQTCFRLPLPDLVSERQIIRVVHIDVTLTIASLDSRFHRCRLSAETVGMSRTLLNPATSDTPCHLQRGVKYTTTAEFGTWTSCNWLVYSSAGELRLLTIGNLQVPVGRNASATGTHASPMPYAGTQKMSSPNIRLSKHRSQP